MGVDYISVLSYGIRVEKMPPHLQEKIEEAQGDYEAIFDGTPYPVPAQITIENTYSKNPPYILFVPEMVFKSDLGREPTFINPDQLNIDVDKIEKIDKFKEWVTNKGIEFEELQWILVTYMW